MFDKKIYESILKAWELDQNHPYRNRQKKPLPSMEGLKVLLDVSFQASLKKEENNFVTFAVVLLPKNQIENENKSGRYQLILSFGKSLPFTVETIAKLAPAFSHKDSALIVEPKENSTKEYEIWGAMYFKGAGSLFTRIPASYGGYSYSRPDAIMITAISTGSLLISRGDSQIGRFVSGNFSLALPTPFESKAMGKYIIDCIKDDELYKEYGNSYLHIFIEAISYLLSDISVRGHGSTIIIIPEKLQEKYNDKYHEGYIINEDFRLKHLFEYVTKPIAKPLEGNDLLFKVLCRKLISELLSALAQLSCIDGALILNNNFKPLSFGAKLTSNKWAGDVILGPVGSFAGGNVFSTSNLGTRHNSAIDFIGASDKAIAFVISQDGPVRGFVKKDKNKILCWPDCRSSMFV